MTLTSGTKLGPYEIQSPLGAGGMGEVHRARDTRLERTVAIKVLPHHLSSNPDLKQRFEREARSISSLNHPRICTLHDVGHQDGVDFLVMEYLEGESLADRLRKRAAASQGSPANRDRSLRGAGMTHVRTSPYYPQSNGKIERWHKSLKSECIRPGTPLSLEDARRLVESYVEHYNNVRLNSAIGYITPKDVLAGRQQEIHAERDRKMEAARRQRQSRRQQAA